MHAMRVTVYGFSDIASSSALYSACWPVIWRLKASRTPRTDPLSTDKETNPHAGKLKVVVYETTHIASTANAYTALSAHDLASADIVLTTYDTLRVDFHRVRDDNTRSYGLRRPKKYEVRCYLLMLHPETSSSCSLRSPNRYCCYLTMHPDMSNSTVFRTAKGCDS